MNCLVRKLFGFLLALIVLPDWPGRFVHAAEPPLRVLAVSPPVWLQRGDSSAPLRPGTALQKQDVVTVGATGGAVMHLDDVRLGLQANTTWVFPDDAESAESDKSAGTLLEGGITIDSTNALPRSIPIRLTLFDLAGKPAIFAPGSFGGAMAAKAAASICLTRGSAEFDGVRLADKAGHSLPVGAGAAPGPEILAQCFSIATGGAEGLWLTQDGRWQVVLASSEQPDSIKSLLAYLRNNGYPATLESVVENGTMVQRVVIAGFAARGSAAALSAELKGRIPGVSDPTVAELSVADKKPPDSIVSTPPVPVLSSSSGTKPAAPVVTKKPIKTKPAKKVVSKKLPTKKPAPKKAPEVAR